MKLAIDAVNIRSGGGVAHLVNLLMNFVPLEQGFDEVHIWTNRRVAKLLPNREWLHLHVPFWADYYFPFRIIFHPLYLSRSSVLRICDILFVPSGTLANVSNIPCVLMSQNMLPFEPGQALLFGRFSLARVKMYLLRLIQISSFSKSDGLIFLTNYAKISVLKWIKSAPESTRVIPHGVEYRFRCSPRQQKAITYYSFDHPFKFIYVSVAMPYKHQIEVADAFAMLRSKGVPVEISFIGEAIGNYGQKFLSHLKSLDPNSEFLKFNGNIEYSSLHGHYCIADAFVFASSCENLPNILIEAMSAGLPIICSSYGPMPEVLGESGLYFDPYDPNSIFDSLEKVVGDHILREALSKLSFDLSNEYSWAKCASATFDFLASTAIRKKTVL